MKSKADLPLIHMLKTENINLIKLFFKSHWLKVSAYESPSSLHMCLSLVCVQEIHRTANLQENSYIRKSEKTASLSVGIKAPNLLFIFYFYLVSLCAALSIRSNPALSNVMHGWV